MDESRTMLCPKCGNHIDNVVAWLEAFATWICRHCAADDAPRLKGYAKLTCETCGEEFDWLKRHKAQKPPKNCPECRSNPEKIRRVKREREAGEVEVTCE